MPENQTSFRALNDLTSNDMHTQLSIETMNIIFTLLVTTCFGILWNWKASNFLRNSFVWNQLSFIELVINVLELQFERLYFYSRFKPSSHLIIVVILILEEDFLSSIIFKNFWLLHRKSVFTLNHLFYISVEDMIKEVDVDGDGRIDFYGKLIWNNFLTL